MGLVGLGLGKPSSVFNRVTLSVSPICFSSLIAPMVDSVGDLTGALAIMLHLLVGRKTCNVSRSSTLRGEITGRWILAVGHACATCSWVHNFQLDFAMFVVDGVAGCQLMCHIVSIDWFGIMQSLLALATRGSLWSTVSYSRGSSRCSPEVVTAFLFGAIFFNTIIIYHLSLLHHSLRYI